MGNDFPQLPTKEPQLPALLIGVIEPVIWGIPAL